MAEDLINKVEWDRRVAEARQKSGAEEGPFSGFVTATLYAILNAVAEGLLAFATRKPKKAEKVNSATE